MPRVEAARELLAPREDVWAFLAEPRHLADWWPGVAAVEPDRRGLAAGARWQIRGTNRPSFFRSPNPSGMLLVLAAARPERLVFQLTGERIEAELRLEASAAEWVAAHLLTRSRAHAAAATAEASARCARHRTPSSVTPSSLIPIASPAPSRRC